MDGWSAWLGKSLTIRANSSRNPFNEARLFVKFGDLQRRASVCVAGQKVGSRFNEQCQSLRPGVPLSRIMDGRSAAETLCVDICAVRDQPRYGPMVPLMSERLQKGASSASSVIDGNSECYESFGDVVCRPVVTLKMAERSRETRI